MGCGRRYAGLVARYQAADIHLDRCREDCLVISVAAHELPLGVEYVVETCHAEVLSEWGCSWCIETQSIYAVRGNRSTTAWLIPRRQKGPNGFDRGIQSQRQSVRPVPWVAGRRYCDRAAVCRLNQRACTVVYGRAVQVVLCSSK